MADSKVTDKHTRSVSSVYLDLSRSILGLVLSVALLVMVITIVIDLWTGGTLHSWFSQDRTVADAIFDGGILIAIAIVLHRVYGD